MKAKQLMLLLLLTAALIGVVAWLIVGRPRNPMTIPEVDVMIQRGVSLGSSRSQVEAFLDSKSITYSYLDNRKNDLEPSSDVDLGGIAIEQLGGITMAMIRDTSRGLFVSGDIRIVFFFDKQGKLSKYRVKEIFTGA